MLSSLIYETFDFVYTIANIASRSITGVYSWYFKNRKWKKEENLQMRLLEERIIELEEQKHNLYVNVKNI